MEDSFQFYARNIEKTIKINKQHQFTAIHLGLFLCEPLCFMMKSINLELSINLGIFSRVNYIQSRSVHGFRYSY